MTVSEIITAVDNFAWGPVLIIFSLGCGLLFSIALKFPQIRLFKQMLNCSFKNKKANSGLTPFQALSIAIGGRVGTGNITGTASAIMFGGPGAVFWMCVMAVICSASAYIESALAQVWKRRVNGEYPNMRMSMVLNWSISFSILDNWIMNIPMMCFCGFCVGCKIADRTLLSQKRETTSQRVK